MNPIIIILDFFISFGFSKLEQIFYKNSIFKLYLKFHYIIFVLLQLINIAVTEQITAQEVENPPENKSVQDSIVQTTDSTTVDSIPVANTKTNAIKEPIFFSAKDSMLFEMKTKKVYLYGTSTLKTEDKELEAELIDMDMTNSVLFAQGRVDSAGNIIGKPKFKDGGKVYDIANIKYNFDTKEGIVKEMITEESGGYLHSETTKMHPNGEVHIRHGKFTTCDAEHPHFYVELSKAKVIPNEKIISGPLVFVIADVYTPLALPFGIFPSQQSRSSGVLIPTYGEEVLRGFFLRDGGFYFAINDNMDAAIRGDIYSLGSWGVRVNSNFKKRYLYTGKIDIKYDKNIEGESGLPTYAESTSFWTRVSYTQDPKAKPLSNFSVNLNFGTSNFKRYNSVNISDLTNNTSSSSASFRRTWRDSPFNLNVGMNATQNFTTQDVNLSLPTVGLSMTRQFPFKRQNSTGKDRWYEKISVSYNASAKNLINTKDTLLFRRESLAEMQNGFKHTVPVGLSLKMLKFFNVSPNFTYTGRVYLNSIEKYYEGTQVFPDTVIPAQVFTDTISGIKHAYDFSLNIPLTTNFYGMLQFPRGPIKAIRHVVTPSISFSYRPDFSEEQWGFYKIEPNDTSYRKYSIFSNGIYGGPLAGKSGMLNFSLGNNFEMKTAARDTSKEDKKIKLIESLNFGTSYNIMKDTLKWSDISISARTRLFQVFSISYSSAYSLYNVSETGGVINEMLIDQGQFWRFMYARANVDATITSTTFGGGGSGSGNSLLDRLFHYL